MQIWPGQPYPLGATFDGVGTNFSIFSESAERVELCLFDDAGDGNAGRPARGHGALLARATCRKSGRASATAIAIHGPWAPEQGLWCNPHKLLMDPYAKAIEGMWEWNEAVFPYHFAEPGAARRTISTARRSARGRS